MDKKTAIALGIGIGVVAAVGITAAVLYNKGVKNVIVTLGDKGSML